MVSYPRRQPEYSPRCLLEDPEPVVDNQKQEVELLMLLAVPHVQ